MYCEVAKVQCKWWKGRFVGCTSPMDCPRNMANSFARACLIEATGEEEQSMQAHHKRRIQEINAMSEEEFAIFVEGQRLQYAEYLADLQGLQAMAGGR